MVPSIVQALIMCGAQVVVACRDRVKGGSMLTERLAAHDMVDLISLTALESGFDGVVHATPMTLSDWRCAEGRATLFQGVKWYYDVAYGDVAQCNCQLMHDIGVPFVRDGVGMLVAQACAAFSIWNQCTVPDAVMTHVMSHLQGF